VSITCRMPLSLLLLASSGGAFATSQSAFEIDPVHSTVRIASPDSQQPFTASISNLAGSLRLNGEQMIPRSLELVFDLASLHSGDASLDALWRSPSHLSADRRPYGLTLATDVSAIRPGEFQADAMLTPRDVSCKAPVEFNWRMASEGGQAVGYLHGTAQVSAQDIHIQNGDAWYQPITVAYDLRVTPAVAGVGEGSAADARMRA
jgi:polyisoprenoid-binding protein YceI